MSAPVRGPLHRVGVRWVCGGRHVELCAVAEPKDPALLKMRDWPMFRRLAGKRQLKKPALDGRAPPRISELLMSHVPGPPSEKLRWLQEQKAAGKLDGDDPDEIAEAETLLAMLVRVSGSKGGKEKRHLDELLDEGLRATFPASDPVSVGHFTGTEAPSRPIDRDVIDLTGVAKTKGRRTPARVRRYG
jgi:hypothetical protein